MDNKRKAVLYMILSTLAFSIMQFFVKIVEGIPVYEKVFFRNLVSFIVSLIILLIIKKPLFGNKGSKKFLLFRSMLGFLGLMSFFYAVDNMVMADATILNRLSPFIVTILAFLFLKEKITKIQIIVLIGVFIGALLIIKPQMNTNIIPSISALLSAVFAGGAYTILRFLKNKENPFTIVFVFSLFTLCAIIPFAAINFVIPSNIDLIFLVLVGVFASLGQIFLTYSYKYAPASEISIYNYLTVLFVSLISFFLLNEYQDIFSIIGSVIIVMMAIINYFYMEKKQYQN